MARFVLSKEARAMIIEKAIRGDGVNLENLNGGFEKWRIEHEGHTFHIVLNPVTPEVKHINLMK